MRIATDVAVLSPSDLSNFLSCRHRVGLDLAVARGKLPRPHKSDPFARMLQEHGDRHERAYVDSLRAAGLQIVDLKHVEEGAEKTLAAMRDGVDVIVQARLSTNDLAGIADVLVRVETSSAPGLWSYEAHDTKLAHHTSGGTILQLSAYSDLLARIQGHVPERFHVIAPDEGDHELFTRWSYRVQDYAAYYRMVLAAMRAELKKDHVALQAEYYPEPVEACARCVWEQRCESRRRTDDHLSLIANAGRSQRTELNSQGFRTLAAVATMDVPVTFKPARGSRETYDRLGHQARVQLLQRTSGSPVFERLAIAEAEGLGRLPLPSHGDLFLDLEGARFARKGGREYLFGVWGHGGYRYWWAMNDGEERAAFDAVIDLIMQIWAEDPAMHVYHFHHYEPTALKKLMGRYVTRTDEIDRLLRAGRFVDLLPITRKAVRAGVESYSIKQLEIYTSYTRQVALDTVRGPRVAVEIALDANQPASLAPELLELVRGYNEDDCRSAQALRGWLESLRLEWEREGVAVPRPAVKAASPEAAIAVQQQAVALRERVLAMIPAEAGSPSHPDHPRWLLAYLVDWHRREVNAEWWEFYRLLESPEEDLLDERKAVAGLQFVEQLELVLRKGTNKPTGSVIQRYTYPSQDLELKTDKSLKLRSNEVFGHVVAFDRERRLIDVKKGKAVVDIHPSCVVVSDVNTTDVQQGAVIRFAQRMLQGADECGTQLLDRQPPRLRSGAFGPLPDEAAQDFALRIVTDLDRTVLAIQGPPGSGKTFVGAQMIRTLAAAGKKVGVVATNHKVIRNLLDEIVSQAANNDHPVKIGVKPDKPSDEPGIIAEFSDNPSALAAIASGKVDVFGGTHFLWSREEFAGTVDVLFVDEAGQMSLANVLAVSQACDSLVLLGDPQQLEQPQKATHPDGVGVSALQHVLGENETMPADRGIFLPVTWRMSPTLTAFTSELFYEGKLKSKPGLDAQRLEGTGVYDGSHLWFIPVEHDGNQSASMEEVGVVEELVRTLLSPGVRWIAEGDVVHPLTCGDIRVVAPFNAQVNRLNERLAGMDVPVGTVDKFQGQTAAVVIYSMTTSRPEDAPRGLEFLYSLNRLNVATSRARCAVFIVASPRLFEPECQTPRQMQLANAMCRYNELARRPGHISAVTSKTSGEGVQGE